MLFDSVNSTMNNSSISAKKKFQILLRLMKNNKFSSTPPLVENNKIVNDPAEKCEIFNTFFASKSTVNDAMDESPVLQKLNNIETLDTINTSPIEVAKLVRSLKKSHTSHCGISGKFMEIISQPISHSLSKLFNNLFEFGHFPHLWKIAHITPIYKRNGPKNDKSNFRPISILPTLSKVCESVIHQRLLNHCIENNIIFERQAAYLKGDSTLSQLLYIEHQIILSWGNSKIMQAAFLDKIKLL